jgi:hypothetical protein
MLDLNRLGLKTNAGFDWTAWPVAVVLKRNP